jgi:tetratricopeptide (TPR) repeat protein
MQYGTTEKTSSILAFVGIMLCGALQKFQAGRKFGDLALKWKTRKDESRTLFLVYEFVMHWSAPAESAKKPLLQAYESGMLTGDLESAFWGAYSFLDLQIHCGGDLRRIFVDSVTFLRQSDKFNQTRISWSIAMVTQCVQNLLESRSKKHILQGDYMDEFEFEKKTDPKDNHTLLQLNRYRVYTAFWLREYQHVVKIMENFGFHNFSIEKAIPATYGIPPLYFYCALACISVARENRAQGRQRSRTKKFFGRIKCITRKGDPNTKHYESLIEAELLSDAKNPQKANKSYETAILLAGRWGFTNDHALAHERYGEHCRRHGDLSEAKYHYDKAINLYVEWGAHAVADDLRVRLTGYNVPCSVAGSAGGASYYEDNRSFPSSMYTVGTTKPEDPSIGGDNEA